MVSFGPLKIDARDGRTSSRLEMIRLLTIFVVVGACTYTAMRGYEVVEFSVALERRGSDEGEHILRWRNVPGVSGAAIEESLKRIPFGMGSANAQNRADELTSLLGVRPLSSTDWLSLAGVQVAAGGPNDRVLSALTMSQLSGPNEGILMLQRGLFGLLFWETLSDALRQRVIRDVAGAIAEDTLSDPTASRINEIMAGKSPETRSKIAGMLGADGVPSTSLRRIGL